MIVNCITLPQHLNLKCASFLLVCRNRGIFLKKRWFDFAITRTDIQTWGTRAAEALIDWEMKGNIAIVKSSFSTVVCENIPHFTQFDKFHFHKYLIYPAHTEISGAHSNRNQPTCLHILYWDEQVWTHTLADPLPAERKSQTNQTKPTDELIEPWLIPYSL